MIVGQPRGHLFESHSQFFRMKIPTDPPASKGVTGVGEGPATPLPQPPLPSLPQQVECSASAETRGSVVDFGTQWIGAESPMTPLTLCTQH